MDEFIVFILTHGRPDNLRTVTTLRKQGYTGQIHLIIDDQDSRADEYFALDLPVHQFNKSQLASQTDCGDNFAQMATITHARNASYQIAQKIGAKYWTQLDDDYHAFNWRFYAYGNPKKIHDLDRVWAALLSFYKAVPASCVAMSQGGDWIGGKNNQAARTPKLRRKAMNSFICSNDRPMQFVGTFNEDVATYTSKGQRGKLFFTVPWVSLEQMQTQSQEGGITELYLNYGTYTKAFSTVTMSPSCVKVGMLRDRKSRIHHQVIWRNCVPKILDEKHRK